MGLILDSSIIIAAERRRHTASQLFQHILSVAGDQSVAMSSIGLTEIVHGIHRASSIEMRSQRLAFVEELLADLEVVSYTRSTAFLAGRIDGEQRNRGITIPAVDLMIGVTALEIGYSIVTGNERHFRLIPGLSVIAI